MHSSFGTRPDPRPDPWGAYSWAGRHAHTHRKFFPGRQKAAPYSSHARHARESRQHHTEVKRTSKEKEIAAQLQELGAYHPAFDPAIHLLCIAERELSRMRKQYKTEGSDPTSPLAAAIDKKEARVMEYRHKLGLTPAGLQKLRKAAVESKSGTETQAASNPGFAALYKQIQEAAHVSRP